MDTAQTQTRPVNLILLAPPGAGKGTQTRPLVEDRGPAQLSTGHLLRAAVAAASPAGLAAKAVMARGDLVSGRFTCATCGEGCHNAHKAPATDGTCDKCGSHDFKRRADDNAETVRERLAASHAETAPLIVHCAAAGKLAHVDAMAEIDDVANAIHAAI